MSHAVIVEPGRAEYPRDCWYVAAFSREVTDQPFARTILDDPMVFYRNRSGDVVALFDRCPHRGMPLSKGTLLPGGHLQCVYHGFEFGEDGRCKLIPAQDQVPSRLAVHRYPVVEKWQWVWVWPGDPALADPALIPDHHYLGFENPDWFSHASIYLPVQANYLLPFENLVDATHISYLHHGMIDDGNVARHPYRLEQNGNVVRIVREFENEPQGTMVAAQNGLPPGVRFNRTLLLESWAPNLCNISVRFVLSERPDDEPRRSHLLVAITPETVRSTHQFVATSSTHNAPVPGEVRDQGLRNLLSEDVEAIETIQALADRLPLHQQPEISQRADEGAIRSRRVIARMIEQERMRMAAE